MRRHYVHKTPYKVCLSTNRTNTNENMGPSMQRLYTRNCYFLRCTPKIQN